MTAPIFSTDGGGRRWRGRLVEVGKRAACVLEAQDPGPKGLPVELGVSVAALKPCGAERLPDIGPVQDLHEFLDRSRRPAPGDAVASDGRDLVLDRGAGTSPDGALRGRSGSPPLRILVGPEGGLEPEELDPCRASGFRPVHLGPRNLRFETAALCALTAVGARAWSKGGDGADLEPSDDEEVRNG